MIKNTISLGFLLLAALIGQDEADSAIVRKLLPYSGNPRTWWNHNINEVEQGRLYRSATMGKKDLVAHIKQHAIATLVVLRQPEIQASWYADVHQAAQETHITLIFCPLTTQAAPTKEQLHFLYRIITTATYPIHVMCHAGADRSGLFCALWRFCNNYPLESCLEQQRIAYGHVWFIRPKMRETILFLYALKEKYGSILAALDSYNEHLF